jgi:hypothetical protein
MGRVWAVLFWIWGFLGLVSVYAYLFIPTMHKMTIDDKLAWIGGMILFGLGALMSRRQPPPQGS